MMKRICFVVTLGGTYRAFLLELSHYLINHHQYDVTVICGYDDSMYSLTGEHLHYIPVKMKRGISFDGPRVIWELFRIFKREKFDIVQYSTYNAGTYASVASWLAGIQCRLYCQWGMMFAALKGVKRVLLKLDEKLIASMSTTIEVESYSVYEEALANHIYKKDKAQVIWNGSACGVDIEKYDISHKTEWRREIRERYGIGQNVCVFGYCGRITRDKGINELFASFRELLKERSAVLMIIGGYDSPESLDPDLLNWAKECPDVIFTGRTNQVPVYYSALDVFISLSYREGFGLVVIEAGAMGVPGIVTDVLGQRDTVEEGISGVIVPGHDVNHVVEAMRFFIDRPERRVEMGEAARRIVVEKYDQKELFRLLAEHRDELINSGR